MTCIEMSFSLLSTVAGMFLGKVGAAFASEVQLPRRDGGLFGDGGTESCTSWPSPSFMLIRRGEMKLFSLSDNRSKGQKRPPFRGIEEPFNATMMIALDGMKSPSPSVRLKSRQRDSKKVWALLVAEGTVISYWPTLPDTEFSGTVLFQLFAHAGTQTAYYGSLLPRETK
jgi:hypothetical protein